MTVDVFSCQRCGHCCEGEGGIVLTREDRIRLAELLDVAEDELVERAAEHRGEKLFLRTGPDGYCLFYDPSINGCSVHLARPDVCRAWPFFRGNMMDEDSLDMARADCPGISKTASFEDFVREGRSVLRSEGLGRDDDDAPSALRPVPDKGSSGERIP